MKYIDSILYAHRRSTIKLLIIFSHLATVSTANNAFRLRLSLHRASLFSSIGLLLFYRFRIALTRMGRLDILDTLPTVRSFAARSTLTFFPER